MYVIGILIILFSHWVFDAVFQSEYTGMNKHSDNWILFEHVFAYSILMALVMAISMAGGYMGPDGQDAFWAWSLAFGITFVCHFITDYFTSRWNHKTYLTGNTKRLVNQILFDQFLHQAQIVITWTILFAMFYK